VSQGLANRALLRRLTVACRRTGAVRRRKWWRLLRSRRPSTGNEPLFRILYRVVLCTLIALCGGNVAWNPLSAQLLALAGIVIMQARMQQIRNRLHADVRLAALAQLPVPSVTLFDFQLRPLRFAPTWSGIDAAGFWIIAWHSTGEGILWWHVLAIACAHAALTDAMAYLLVKTWARTGLLFYLVIAGMVLGTCKHAESPWLWSAIQPLMQAVAWFTPWGWVNFCAIDFPKHELRDAVCLFSIATSALIVSRLAYSRLRRSWTLDPQWREVAGRPVHTIADPLASGSKPEVEKRAPSPSPDRTADQVDLAVQAQAARAREALAQARTCESGLSVQKLGWVGRWVIARCEQDDRVLVDLLGPSGPSPSTWRWSLTFAILPAACSLLGLTMHWSLGALLVILLVRRMPRRALFTGLLLLTATSHPDSAPLLGNVLPCLLALLMVVPCLGGIWKGLPVGCTPLGSLPRTWSRMMRIMASVIGMRLVSSLPILILVLVALSLGVDPALAELAGTAWLIIALTAPWLLAMHVARRTPGGIDVSLGRWYLTASNIACIALHTITAVVLIMCAAVAAANARSFMASDYLIAGIAMGSWACVSVVHIALLRHAYRRVVDLIPPV
jgi:hypothetical protein